MFRQFSLSHSVSISILSLHFLSISSFSLHFVFISSFSLHFLAARLQGCNNFCSPVQCTMCTLFSFFSPRPNEVRHILKFPCCHTIQHIFVPARSIEGKMEKNWFPWLSNSKFVIFPQIFPCSNYRILAFYAPIPVKIHGNSIIPL